MAEELTKEEKKIRESTATQIGRIIAAINPDKYYKYNTKSELNEFRNILKKQGFWQAVDKAKAKPAEQFKLVYDSNSETLEPLYFWILDFTNNMFNGDVEKLTDNFTSSPGSGHFAELGARATRMQEEGMKIMQTIGVLIKSLINLIYDLREFEIRFESYDSAKSKDKEKEEAGMLSLKQIWLDNVDIKRGNSSIKAMAFSNAAFVTLLDAFMIVKDEKLQGPNRKEIDLNDRVKRILKQRILEFNKWRELSEKELRKRYEIQRSWLKSQVNSLQLYSKWAKPYLRAAQQLTGTESKSAALVKAFNTVIMELTLFAKSKVDVEEATFDKELPEEFKKLKKIRDYYSCVLIDFNFRGIPQKMGQHYIFGGRAEITFSAYALNQEEINLLKAKLAESDLNESLNFIEGATTESLEKLKEDVDYFLKEKSERPEEKIKEKTDDVNPFLSLFGFGKKKEEETKTPIKEIIKKDKYSEKLIRTYGEKQAISSCFDIFDIYKKAHGMASVPFVE